MGCCCLSIWMSSEEEQVCGENRTGGWHVFTCLQGKDTLYLVAVFQRPGQNNLGVFVTKSCFCPGV